MALLVTTVLPMLSGLPKDVAVNNWVFDTDAANAAQAASDAESFFLTTYSTDSVSKYLSASLDRGNSKATSKVYDITGHLDGSDHGSPILTRQWTIGAISGAASLRLPEEVAVTLSFNSDLTGLAEEAGATRPKARHRGRVYIGPLNDLALTYDSTTGRTKVAPALQAVMRAAALDLAAKSTNWAVWSRTNAALYNVRAGFIDDAFDTQRRRGPKAVSRSTWDQGA